MALALGAACSLAICWKSCILEISPLLSCCIRLDTATPGDGALALASMLPLCRATVRLTLYISCWRHAEVPSVSYFSRHGRAFRGMLKPVEHDDRLSEASESSDRLRSTSLMTSMRLRQALCVALLSTGAGSIDGAVVINTWPFTHATAAAFEALTASGGDSTHHALDAITAGCNRCEIDQCDFTVGYGGSPDSEGETTLDAMILDGTTMGMGAVARLRRVKDAIKVARAVMEHTAHSILAGDGALAFAKMMGFQEESLETDKSRAMYTAWRAQQCQPNYFRNVVAQNASCPPYRPLHTAFRVDAHDERFDLISSKNHDTIGMVVLDGDAQMAAGTSSNGANHKVAGRVGDAAVPGAGAYVDSQYGGAAATGDGDIMMRFLPSFHAVQDMANGMHPQTACERALMRVARVFPSFKGGMVCLNRLGEYGGAGHGWQFSYSVQTSAMRHPQIVQVEPMALE